MQKCINFARDSSRKWGYPICFRFNGAHLMVKANTTGAEAHESYDKQVADIINRQIIANSVSEDARVRMRQGLITPRMAWEEVGILHHLLSAMQDDPAANMLGEYEPNKTLLAQMED